jgi:two-component system LytT family response regulator
MFVGMASAGLAEHGADRLRVLIVDHQRVARQEMKHYLAAERDVTIVGECAHGRAAADTIRRTQPDLVFLDAHMPSLDGFEMLRQVGAAALPEVVFVAVHGRDAVKAFDVHAVDYLLKPFHRERFRLALERARVRRAAARGREGGAMDAGPRAKPHRPGPQRIVVTTRGRRVLLATNEIDWIQSADNYVRLFTQRGEYLARETLAGLQDRLDDTRFVRVHRRAVVNVDAIAEARCRGDHWEVCLRTGDHVRVGRGHRARLLALLKR